MVLDLRGPAAERPAVAAGVVEVLQAGLRGPGPGIRKRRTLPDDHSVGAVSSRGAGEVAGHAPARVVLPHPGRQEAPRPGSPSRPRRILLGPPSGLPRGRDGCRPPDHLGVVPDGRAVARRVTVDRRRAPAVLAGAGGGRGPAAGAARSGAMPRGSFRVCGAHPGCRGRCRDADAPGGVPARMPRCRYARLPVCPSARLPVCRFGCRPGFPAGRLLDRLLVRPSVRPLVR